jgi:hypothetical protein
MPSSNGSLVIAIKTESIFHAAAILLYYILQKNYTNKSGVVFEAMLPYIIRGLILKGANVAPTSQVCASAMLL